MKKLKELYSNPANWWLFILTAIFLRGIVWCYFAHSVEINIPSDNRVGRFIVKDDYNYFFAVVDNFFKFGSYSYFPRVPFSGRLPGYSIVYLLARYIFSQHTAILAVIGLQFLLSSISVYFLALTSKLIFNNGRCFHVTFWLYVLAVFPGFFDFFVLAESFSASAFVFCLYFLSKYYATPRTKYLILSGLFLTWTIFLREFTGLLIVLIPSILGIYLLFIQKQKFFKVVATLFLFCTPFIVADSIWVIRNYINTKTIILVTTPEEQAYGKLYDSKWQALDNLVYCWGENSSPFDPASPGTYFRYVLVPYKYEFPKAIFNNVTTYNQDSLVKLRNIYRAYITTDDSAKERVLGNAILDDCSKYKNDYITHNQFAYWIIKPLRDFKYLALFSGSGYLPLPVFSQAGTFDKALKILFSILYYFLFLCGITGLLLTLSSRKRLSPIKLTLIAIFFIITLTILMIGSISSYSSIQEPRYFIHAFIVLILFASWLISHLIDSRQQPNS